MLLMVLAGELREGIAADGGVGLLYEGEKLVRIVSRLVAGECIGVPDACDPPFSSACGVEFAWSYQPCDELAGDGLNIIQLGDEQVGLYVLDVSGHGVSAALLSVTLSRLLSMPSDPSSILVKGRGTASQFEITPPAEVAERLNLLFPYDIATEQFATLVYGILDASTGDFRYVSAGHPGPLHQVAGETARIVDSPGFPIGLGSEAYEERCIQLAAGDRLYLYSDGLPDAMSPTGERFGNARLLDLATAEARRPLGEGVALIEDEITRWQGGESFQDDISLLAVEISPGQR